MTPKQTPNPLTWGGASALREQRRERWVKCPVCECGYDNAHPCKMCGFGWADDIGERRAKWKALGVHLELDPITGMRFWSDLKQV